jgi:hypothetical protein|tara:strand:- start:6138 stop:6329 length:192 start_codon:yes stop_codon:yes gene_type:complete
MRVVDKRKWRRAKLVLFMLDTVALLWCMGGLEGEQPMPYPTATVMLLFVTGYMTHNLTKHWKH